MKIDLPPVRCFDEAAIFPGEEVLDAAVAFFRMMLHLTAKFAHDVFDLSHCSVEGLPDRDQRVFALGRVGMGLVDDDFVVLGDRDAKLDLEAAAAMSGLRPGDDDATTRNARTEILRRRTCAAISDRISSDGSECRKAMSTGVCISIPPFPLSRRSRNQKGVRRLSKNQLRLSRAVLDDPPIHIRPNCSRQSGCKE